MNLKLLRLIRSMEERLDEMETDASAETRDRREREWSGEILAAFDDTGDPEEAANRVGFEYKKWLSRHGPEDRERLQMSIDRVMAEQLPPSDKLRQMFATIAGDGESEFLVTMLPKLIERLQEDRG